MVIGVVVVKYFFEEPASLEILASEEAESARTAFRPCGMDQLVDERPVYRGYLAASDLSADQTGATASGCLPAWLDPLVRVLETGPVRRIRAGMVQEGGLAGFLAEGQRGDILLVGGSMEGLNSLLGDSARGGIDGLSRDQAAALRQVLESGATLLFAEAAFHGVDWSILASKPLADRVRDAFRGHAAAGATHFVIPSVKARGEHKFYFERYDLSLFEAYRVLQ